MSGLKKWLEKRIFTLKADRVRRALLLPSLPDDEYERNVDKMVSAGCKAKAFKEVLDYMATHEVEQ